MEFKPDLMNFSQKQKIFEFFYNRNWPSIACMKIKYLTASISPTMNFLKLPMAIRD